MTEFEAIYKEYFRDVYLYILGLSGNEHIAEEITEETFFKALKALDSFRGECDIRVWLCQIAKNEYYFFLRKNKRLVMTDFLEQSDENCKAESNISALTLSFFADSAYSLIFCGKSVRGCRKTRQSLCFFIMFSSSLAENARLPLRCEITT